MRYWRGLWRYARKRTREQLFGSRERVVIAALVGVAYVGLAVWLLPKIAGDSLRLAFAAGVAPLVIYPGILAWKRLAASLRASETREQAGRDCAICAS